MVSTARPGASGARAPGHRGGATRRISQQAYNVEAAHDRSQQNSFVSLLRLLEVFQNSASRQLSVAPASSAADAAEHPPCSPPSPLYTLCLSVSVSNSVYRSLSSRTTWEGHINWKVKCRRKHRITATIVALHGPDGTGIWQPGIVTKSNMRKAGTAITSAVRCCPASHHMHSECIPRTHLQRRELRRHLRVRHNVWGRRCGVGSKECDDCQPWHPMQFQLQWSPHKDTVLPRAGVVVVPIPIPGRGQLAAYATQAAPVRSTVQQLPSREPNTQHRLTACRWRRAR